MASPYGAHHDAPRAVREPPLHAIAARVRAPSHFRPLPGERVARCRRFYPPERDG